MVNNDLYIGLDVGTDSVGWACTDENYNLCRIKGKTAWGVRIFDQAKDSKTRRTFRSNKRRQNRRKYRISLLDSLFAKPIGEIDSTFFTRLKYSNLFNDDKSVDAKCECPLFKSKEKEKEFYKMFPTIYHLRKGLMDNDEKAFSDVRYFYLALHHIIKYRGNFLTTDEFTDLKPVSDESIDRLNEAFKLLVDSASTSDDDFSESFIFLEKDNRDKLIEILENDDLSKTAKKKQIKGVVKNSGDKLVDKYITLFATIVCGGEYALSEIDDSYETKVSFSNYDENEEKIMSELTDFFPIVSVAKEFYDYVILKKLLGENPNLSSSYVSVYERHKNDLKKLKSVANYIDKCLNNGNREVYRQIFVDGETRCFYSQLSGSKYDESIGEIRKAIKPYYYLLEGSRYAEFIKRLESPDFLKIIANYSTSTIPHQLHLVELKKILENARGVYDFVDDDFVKKVISLFKYRIPYYYGPLKTNENNNEPHSWLVKNKGYEKTSITPWNIEECVNDIETRSKFILRMTKKCSYLLGENVLPKCSILFQDFVNLNRLSTMRINGRVDKKLNKELFDQVISSVNNPKTTVKRLKLELKKRGLNESDFSIEGINEKDDFINSSRVQFTNIFGDLSDNENYRKAETCIFYLTIYSDSPKDALKSIKAKIPSLTTEQEKAICRVKCSGWSTISEKLLTGIKVTTDVGNTFSIFDLLKTLEFGNFNQIINDEAFGFNKLIGEFNREFRDENNLSGKDEMVKDILDNTPAIMRRPIVQTTRIIDEVIKYSKKTPKYISVEVTRTNLADKKETNSRYFELKSFLSSIKEDEELLNELTSFEDKKDKLRGKHLYLYFKQLGIDLYTGEKIKIEDVMNGKYDIDHIVPQSKIKDDSLDNTVLVNKDFNQKIKRDIYPLSHVITGEKYDKMMKIWTMLLHKNAISKEKYNKLTRRTELDDKELSDFVNRQINVVNYANKSLIDVLKVKYPETTIIFSKSQYPTKIRQYLKIAKLRELNDTHHAVDAYLNVFCGIELYRRYSRPYNSNNSGSTYINDEGKEVYSFNMERYLYSKTHVDIKSDELNELGKRIFSNSLKRNFLMTYRNIYREDAFYDAGIKDVESSNSAYPLHTKNPVFMKINRYGGFNNLAISYFVPGKNGKKKTLYDVPIILATKYNYKLLKDRRLLEEELRKQYNIPESVIFEWDNVVFMNQKAIHKGCLVLINNSNKLCISEKTIHQIYLSNDDVYYLKSIKERIKQLDGVTESSYVLFSNKDGENQFVVSKERNLSIFRELLCLANLKRYESVGMIRNNKKIPSEEDFLNKLLSDQLSVIFDMILLFGRNPADSKLCSSLYRPTKNYDEITLIFDSVTGLVSRKKKI